MQSLYIQNSLSRKKELFVPLNPPYVGMYVCGPTVYSNVHLGNVRTFLTFDIVYRYLTFLGYQVRYVRNITDVGHLTGDSEDGEDKIGKKARLENLEPMEIVQKYTNDFHDVTRVFNMISPSIEPSATGHIVEQIEMIQKILERGYGYESNGSVYFNVRKFSEDFPYGELSGRRIDDQLSNTRSLDGQDEKNDPLDFALWKKADASHLMKWPSPWSEGFPGWHLECSVMSTKYLGTTFDIHGGGMDLKFPHHECEIAQNVGAHGGSSPVNYWMHGNMLTVNGRKMAKSEGNGFTPEELITGNHPLLERGYSAMTVRFFMLQGHYASTLDFSNDALQAAEKGLERLVTAMSKLADLPVTASPEGSEADIPSLLDRCAQAMGDDFNTPILISVLFDAVKLINNVTSGKMAITSAQRQELKDGMEGYVFDVLGLKVEEKTRQDGGDTDALMGLLVELRGNAKTNKDWATADTIRDTLSQLGITIMDGKDGSTWKKD
ncbi:MAG: cysteine--tRNA ligase [Flavobacteriales bacterium]|jgi:cysteinyl-tRNA synthetase|nr:cysteine--tRNA ligase [Flavobacteriales bacterium]